MLTLRDLEPATDPEADNGEIFTRRWVVDLILDLAGYTSDKDLAARMAIEPSCGAGAFLGAMVDRLVRSCVAHGRDIRRADGAIRAIDLLADNVTVARELVQGVLKNHGVRRDEAKKLAEAWVRQGDFLLTDHGTRPADYVLGNPPYVRLERLSPDRNAVYREVYPTMRGRSDIFVGFIELGLRLLAPGGVLAFIVADRWMRNQYGSGLRDLVVSDFSVDAVIEMHDVDAFEEPVSAYPAITVIRRKQQEKALVASTTKAFGPDDADTLRTWAKAPQSEALRSMAVDAAWLPGWFDGSESWPWGTPEQVAVVAGLEQRFPPLEDPMTGTKVGIGLATGADDIYLTTDPSLVEAERLLPLVMAKDLTEGAVNWSGTYLVNPWENSGLVDLDAWPHLRKYLESHGDRVRGRHTARKTPDRWHKTIDRMIPGLADRPKLLLPEMKAAAHPVLDEGGFYPHHNLYHITSKDWDLEVLGGLMLSDVTNLLVGSYCVKMRGGCYRFQAQYLRRVRVPPLETLTSTDKRALAEAFRGRDVEAATKAALRVYGITRVPTA